MGKAENKNIKHNPIAWSMWANVLAVYAGCFMFVGGIISQFHFEGYRQAIGVYSLIMGLVIVLFEWPRSKRKHGHTIPRWKQHIIASFMDKLGPLSHNYFARSILWILASVALFFGLPTIIGGVTLALSGLIYFLASFKGESWRALEPPRKNQGGPRVSKAPSKPPPRPPGHNSPLADRKQSAPPRRPAEAQEGNVRPPVSARPAAAPRPKAAPRPAAAPKPGSAPRSTVDKRPIARAHSDFDGYAWKTAEDPETGDVYYYNETSGETSWDKPPRWDEYVALYGEPTSEA